MADGELAGRRVIRFVKDLAATLLLRLLILLLSPGLILVGRTMRAKLVGFRAVLLGVAVVLALAFLTAHHLGLPAASVDSVVVPSLTSGLVLFLNVHFGLHCTRPRRSAEFVEGWSSVDYGRLGFAHADASVADENDLVGLAVDVGTRLNPLLTRAQAATIRATVAADLEAMADRPDIERLPSMLAWDLGVILRDREQAFVYCPPHDRGEKLPLVVVCHGHGGNPLVGCLPWADLADDLGFVVVFPTFGYGNWEHPAAAQAVVRCRRAVTERFAVDETRAVLAGISQGGCGVTRGATVAKWAGLVYVSPTMDVREFAAGTAFAELWTGGPVLVAQGGQDINVEPKSVDAGVAALRSLGVAVTYVQDRDADHFYFFEKRDEFAEQFRAWWPTAIPPAG